MGFWGWEYFTLANPNHVYTNDGYYSVSVRFEDLTGVDSFDFDIISYPIPQVNFTANQLDTCVLPISYNLQNSTIGAATMTGTSEMDSILQ